MNIEIGISSFYAAVVGSKKFNFIGTFKITIKVINDNFTFF